MATYEFDADLGPCGEHILRAVYHYRPAIRGARELGSGVPLEPDVPEHVEVHRIEVALYEDMFVPQTGKWVPRIRRWEPLPAALERHLIPSLESEILEGLRDEQACAAAEHCADIT